MTSEQEQDVRDTLGNAGHPLTTREIALASGVVLSTTRGILTRMVGSGEVELNDGRYRMVREGATPPGGSGGGRRSRTGEHDEVVLQAVLGYEGVSGVTISEVSELVNLPRRVCENTLYRLEEKLGRLVSIGRPKRYLPHPLSGEDSVGM